MKKNFYSPVISSYGESVFPEDLFLYNCLQAKAQKDAIGDHEPRKYSTAKEKEKAASAAEKAEKDKVSFPLRSSVTNCDQL